jgi:hypothetical protein
MNEHEQEVVAQRVISLPFLSDEVPALYLADGRPSIPVFAVCHALGIRADTHIQRWRHLALWVTARKLPLLTEKRGKRLVWCLLISQVPFLYSLFDWKLVSPERRLQLRQASKEQVKLANLAYQEMQQRYKAMRQVLFTFLTTFADIDTFLQRYADVLSLMFDDESSLALTALIDHGRSLFHKAAAHARKMLHDQGELPIVDAIKVNAVGEVVETFSFPLFPLVSDQDSEQFFIYIRQLAQWYRDFAEFL